LPLSETQQEGRLLVKNLLVGWDPVLGIFEHKGDYYLVYDTPSGNFSTLVNFILEIPVDSSGTG
jgi:hypothetical protein